MLARITLAVTLASSGCVTTRSLAAGLSAAADAQADIIAGIDGLDSLCQHSASDSNALAACRTPRDLARAALRRQLVGLQAMLAGGK